MRWFIPIMMMFLMGCASHNCGIAPEVLETRRIYTAKQTEVDPEYAARIASFKEEIAKNYPKIVAEIQHNARVKNWDFIFFPEVFEIAYDEPMAITHYEDGGDARMSIDHTDPEKVRALIEFLTEKGWIVNGQFVKW